MNSRKKSEMGFFQKSPMVSAALLNSKETLPKKVTLQKDGYVFSCHIRQYERDADRGFEIIEPENLADVPEDEKLGRVVYLTITLSE